MKPVKFGIGLTTTLVLFLSSLLSPEPALSSAKDMSPNATLGWLVSEASGGERNDHSRASILVPDPSRPGFWTVAADCREIGSGKTQYLSARSCDPRDYRGKIIVNYGPLMAPVCEAGDRNCISEVFAFGPGGERINGEFLRYIGEYYDRSFGPQSSFIPSNKLIGNPMGASGGIWRLPGVLNSLGTDLYSVDLNMEGGLAEFTNGRLTKKFQIRDRTFNAQITPASSELARSFQDSDGNMPTEHVFGISTILPDSIMSWYSGRVADPDVEYKKLSGGYNRITITGKPITIPVFSPSIKRSEAPAKLLKLYDFCPSEVLVCNGLYNQGMGSQNFLEVWRDLMADKASSLRNVWAIRTVQPIFTGSPNDPRYFACAKPDRAAGISTTNAMLHSGSIPRYEKGFFSYEVSGLHYEPDGTTEFMGQYEMVMDEQLARCMFGFPKAPLSATVNVVNRNGTKAIATTTVGVKNKQLRLSANNFTFSKKTIQVQLRAKGHSTCVRGDTVRYVKGTRCPSGFKKAK